MFVPANKLNAPEGQSNFMRGNQSSNIFNPATQPQFNQYPTPPSQYANPAPPYKMNPMNGLSQIVNTPVNSLVDGKQTY